MIDIPQKFPGKQPGDKVILFVRKHWVKYLVTSIFSLLLVSIPVAAIIFYLTANVEYSALVVELITVSAGVYLLGVMALILHAFVDFYLDMLILTQDRVIFVRQNGFFSQQIDEAHIWDIDECGVDVKGFINSILGCGDLIIHTGNDEAILTVDDIKNPSKVAHEIMRMHKEHVESEGYKKKDIEEDKIYDKDKD